MITTAPSSLPVETDASERVAAIVDDLCAWRRGGGFFYGPWFSAEDLLECEEDLTEEDVTRVLAAMETHELLIAERHFSGVWRYRENLPS